MEHPSARKTIVYIHEIKIDELLLIEIGRGNVLQDVRKQSRHILAKGHGHDGLLDGLLPLIGILGDQTSAELKGFALSGSGECAANAIHRHGRCRRGVGRGWRGRDGSGRGMAV